MADTRPNIIHENATTNSASAFFISLRFSSVVELGTDILKIYPKPAEITPAVKNGKIDE